MMIKREVQYDIKYENCSKEDNLVSFSIKGFSSSKPFEGVLSSKSDSLNIALANLRAINIYNYILSIIDTSETKLDVQLKLWDEKIKMKRPFLDNRDDFGSDKQELFNRSVFISLLSAGACSTYEASK